MKQILLFLILCGSVLATVPESESIRQYFTLGAATTEFEYTIPANSSDDILVYKKLISTGAETLLTITTDYTIASGGDFLTGGIVTIDPALGVLYQVIIVRSIKTSQETAQGAITPTSVVASLDKLTRTVQDLVDRKDRSWRLPNSDAESFDVEMPTLADRASTFPFFNSSGVLTYVSDLITNSETASAFGVSLMQAADATAAKVLLLLSPSDAVEFAGITGTTGTFTDHVTLETTANFVGSDDSDIELGGSGTEKFTVRGATGNTDIEGTLEVDGVAVLGVGSVLDTGGGVISTDADLRIVDKKYVDDNVEFGTYIASDSLSAPIAETEVYLANSNGFVSVIATSTTDDIIITGLVNHGSGLSNRQKQSVAQNDSGSITLMVADGDTFQILITPDSATTMLISWRGMGLGKDDAPTKQ